MDKLAEDTDGVTVRLSEMEFAIVNNSLNEVSNGVRIPESEFEDRLGAPRTETRRLLDAVRGAVDTSGLAPGERAGRAIGPGGMTIRLSVTDLTLLRNAMSEMTKGVEIEEWEYPIRLGATVAEGKQLLVEIEDVIRKDAI